MLRLAAVLLLLMAVPAAAAMPSVAVPPPAEGEPRAPTVNDEAIAAAVEGAGWVSKPGQTGPVLYVIVIGFRTCPTCLAFHRAEHERLLADGVDVRWIVYARADRDGKPRSTPQERAMVAELWLNRTWAAHEAWYAMQADTFYGTMPQPPAADGDAARTAAVEAGRTLVSDLSALYAANGLDLAIPTLLWKDATTGTWMTSIGYNGETFWTVRLSLMGE